VKKTTAEHDPQAYAKLRKLIEDISVAMVTTVTPDGALHSRPMFTHSLNDEGELWFFTVDDSSKAGDLAEEHAVNVSYAEPARDRYVSVTGNATLVHDPDKLHELWEAAPSRYFPKGLDDPHLALLRVQIELAEYWDAAARKMRSVSHDTKAEAGPVNGQNGEHTRVDIGAIRASG
jgi:general stress protein 26